MELALAASPYAVADRVWLVAAGKAAEGMAAGAAVALGERLKGGVVVGATHGPGRAVGPVEQIAGGHPVPNEDSQRAGIRALDAARAAGAGDQLLVLLSGGASAMLAVPAAGLTLADKQQATAVLLREGAEIHRLNAVRKHLSAIKGGQLAAAAGAASRTLLISDVVGDDPSVIASGPTVADPSTFMDALDALDKLGGRAAYPSPVVARLERGAAGGWPETPKPGDPRLGRAEVAVVGGRHHAMEGAAVEARRRGYHAIALDPPVVGEARVAAVNHIRHLAMAADLPRPLCVISSGETTVRVTGGGRGGRNQEFALAAATVRECFGPAAAGGLSLLASVGTDGVDGPTDAAGALVDPTTLDRAIRAGLPAPSEFLNSNDAYAFFAALGDLIKTGPTGTNVGDLQVFLSV